MGVWNSAAVELESWQRQIRVSRQAREEEEEGEAGEKATSAAWLGTFRDVL